MILKEEQLFKYLMDEVHFQEEKRKNELSKIKTIEGFEKRKKHIKNKLEKMMGELPEKTPLKVQKTGEIEYEDYFLEKIIYESRPDFHVTANLYLPKDIESSVPGILAPCGHTYNGKADKKYTKLFIGLAKRGYVVLTYDPISQGERLQYLTSFGKPILGHGVFEHCKMGNLLYLLDENFATYYIWDGIRGIDYLCERQEVDNTRIGCVGNSGGGTATTYISALDERISVAVPSCFVTSLYKRVETRVTADPEQNFTGILSNGIDHSDILLLFAPKPLQINAAIMDFFPIEGVRQAYSELKRYYELLGNESKVNLWESEREHGLYKESREGIYSWLDKWLKENNEEIREKEIEVEAECNLICTDSGQVMTSFPEEKSIFPRKLEENKLTKKAPSNKKEFVNYRSELRKELINLMNLTKLLDSKKSQKYEAIERRAMGNYIFEKVIFESEPNMYISSYIYLPINNDIKKVVIYINEQGKELGLRSNENIKALVKSGVLVIAIDPRGMGEDRSLASGEEGYYSLYGIEADLTYTSFMLGKPILGLRAFDVIRTMDFLELKYKVKSKDYICIGDRYGALITLFATAIDDRISGAILNKMLSDYGSLITNDNYEYHVNSFIPGILKKFDLPDITSIIAPRKLILANLLDHEQKKLKKNEIKGKYKKTENIYKILNKYERFQLKSFQKYEMDMLTSFIFS